METKVPLGTVTLRTRLEGPEVVVFSRLATLLRGHKQPELYWAYLFNQA